MRPQRRPQVSVVMPTYERARLIGRAIASVLDQSYDDLELIVVDDGSTDDTDQVVASFGDDRVRYIRHETNRHASAARNTGIAHSVAGYLAFLDDDDEWMPTKLSAQMELMRDAPPEVGLVYCWMDYYDGGGRVVSEVHPTLRGEVFERVLDKQRLAGCPTLLVRRSVVDDVGGFDESLPRGNDGDFIRRVCQRYRVDVVLQVLVKVHVGHGQQRITRFDEQGIRNAIWSEEVKLKKFAEVLRRHPKLAATINTSIALHYARLGSWRYFLAYQLRALRKAPLFPQVYLRFFIGVRYQLQGGKR